MMLGLPAPSSNVSHTSQPVLPLPLNQEEVLLVDEVDVFFGRDFYGKTYNQVAEIQDPIVEKLLRKIWELRTSNPSLSILSKWPEFSDIKQWLEGWSLQIETEEERICTDLQKFDDPPYEVDVINDRLGYRIKDSVDWELTFGYRTAFAHLFELEHGKLVGGSATTSVCQLLYLWISCSQFSYAHIEPTVVLGVYGILRVLSRKERFIVHDFGVDVYSFVPSVCGSSNLTFEIRRLNKLYENTKEDLRQFQFCRLVCLSDATN